MESSIKVCPKCKSNHTKFGAFCSRHCANSRKKSGPDRKPRFCVVCNEEFIRPDDRRQTKRCEKHRSRVAGVSLESLLNDKARRKFLLLHRGLKCEICGITTWMNQPTPIELDHIDGNPGNNTEKNLRLICPNCHAQTPTHCGKNSRKSFTKSERAIAMAKYPRYRNLKITTLSSNG